VLLGSDRVTTTGELRDVAAFWTRDDVTPEIDAQFAGPSLHLDAIFPPRADDQPTYAEIAFAHLSRRPLDGRNASLVAEEMGLHRVKGLPLVGSLDLRFDTLAQGERRVDELVARVELTDSVVAVSDASFGVWGGRAHTVLRMGIGTAPYQPFELSLRVEDAAVDGFLAALASEAPSDQPVVGTLDLDLDVGGMTDARLLPVMDGLVAHARVAVADGRVSGTGVNAALADFLESERWAGIPFTGLSGTMDVREGVIEVTDGTLLGDFTRIGFAGLVDFSGAADISFALSVPPEQLGAVSLRRTGIGQSVVDQLRRANQPLDLGMHLSGPLGAPTLEPNAANAVELARR
jgi:hypothetical protein